MSASVASATEDSEALRRKAIVHQDITFQIALWNAHYAQSPITHLPRSLATIARRIASLKAAKEAAEAALSDMLAAAEAKAGGDPRKAISFSIISAVAAKHGVDVAEIINDVREHKVVVARHEAMWRLRKNTALSASQIGRAMGNRDHSSVAHGIRRHEERLKALHG